MNEAGERLTRHEAALERDVPEMLLALQVFISFFLSTSDLTVQPYFTFSSYC